MSKKSNTGAKSVRREQLQDAILEAASRLFIERGFPGTSMGDIAEAMGVTRTAIFYYFRNKEAILNALTASITEMAGKLAEETLAQQHDPMLALRALVCQHARLILSHPLQFRVVERNEQHLSPSLRKIAQASRRLLLNRFVTAIEAGIRAGQFRDVDPKLAAFSMLGMCNWGAWWFNPQGSMSLDQVIEGMADLALNSVVRGEERRLRGNTIDESVRQLREDLNLLERRLQTQDEAQYQGPAVS